MQEIQQSLAALKLGARQVFRNLALYPLVSGRDARAGYVVLEEALERRLARVTEVCEADADPARSRAIGEYVAAFFPELRQCGAVLAIDGRVSGLELFDSPAAFARYLPKLVRGYALDAVETANGKVLAPPETEVRRFLERVGAAGAERFAALGEGEDIRLSGEGLAGGALAAAGRVVHLAAHGVAR